MWVKLVVNLQHVFKNSVKYIAFDIVVTKKAKGYHLDHVHTISDIHGLEDEANNIEFSGLENIVKW